MKRSTLAAMASTLVLVFSVFTSGFATAQSAPTMVPQVADGTYIFGLTANINLCIVSHGVGYQLTVAQNQCANIKISSDPNNRIHKFFTIHGHCVVAKSNRVVLARDGCSDLHGADVWGQTNSNPVRFRNFGGMHTYLATMSTAGNSKVWSISGNHSNWKLWRQQRV